MKELKELRELKEDQLEVLSEDLQKEVFSLKNQLAINKKLEKPHLIREKKRERARVLMVLSEKKRKK